MRIQVISASGAPLILKARVGRLWIRVGGIAGASGPVIIPTGLIIRLRGGKESQWGSSRLTGWSLLAEREKWAVPALGRGSEDSDVLSAMLGTLYYGTIF